MTNYYFSTKKMCVGYDDKPLIREMEFALQKGEILSLIGPNGAGKSTVLKSIAGQLKLVGGTVYLGGDVLSEMRAGELAKKMSVVFTEKIRAEMKSCRDVVATGRYPYTGWFGILSAEDERIVDEVMELTHITDIGGQDFNKISDGQKQRVMLARAICQEPEIVVLDEPTSYLDIKYKLEFLSVLQEMRDKKGLTVIMSLHELELAKIVSDKILCLKGECVERFGTPGEVFESDFIGRLFGIREEDFAENGKLLGYVRQIGGFTRSGVGQ
ncbi:MAG: ABC transporter ATP-binding protein [Lachnospiraceae bacterium]|nr:ABC transporter ATP-binding protein [Lachnospiraceae bacterium]